MRGGKLGSIVNNPCRACAGRTGPSVSPAWWGAVFSVPISWGGSGDQKGCAWWPRAWRDFFRRTSARRVGGGLAEQLTVPSLFVVSGRDQGAKYELEDGMMGLGRDSSNFIQLHDTEVSRQHAEIRRDGDDLHRLRPGQLQRHLRQRPAGRRSHRAGQRRPGAGRQHADALHRPGRRAPRATCRTRSTSSPRPQPGDSSRIVRSVTPAGGEPDLRPRRPTLPQNSWLARARSNLQVMYRTALAVSHTLDIDQLLNRIMELIFEWVEADRGCIMLLRSGDASSSSPKVRRTRKGVAPDEQDHDQQDDPRLRDRAERRRADQRRPRRTTAGTRRPASCRWASARRSACRCKAATTWSA